LEADPQRVGGELRAVTPKTRQSRRTMPLIGLWSRRALRTPGPSGRRAGRGRPGLARYSL